MWEADRILFIFKEKVWKLVTDELVFIDSYLRDLLFFGMCPLGLHCLNFCNKDLQEMRRKAKPGLIPPFYADLPETFFLNLGIRKKVSSGLSEIPNKDTMGLFLEGFLQYCHQRCSQ